MKKYITKQEIVEAQQWFPGVEIPVLKNVACTYVTSSSSVGSYNSKVTVYEGHWVVQYKNGRIEIIPHDEFVRRFEGVYP